MARASIKEDLILDSNVGYRDLMALIENMESDLHTEFLFEDRDRSVRDVLAHLHEWHNLFFVWYEIGMAGDIPAIPKEGFTWSTIGGLNEAIVADYANVSYEETCSRFMASHAKVMEMMNNHTNTQLFKRYEYAWTGDTVLGSYFVSTAPSHYEWAIKKLKKQQRLLKKIK
ncbi:ClbS/DfsB family four-helix bundle protein [Erysipelothrix sp. HDW6C]|uniref:ClbS/DfsB family four-helix bundle protein n=1 Tax=Erysipelothrix sp. HDW6C TaxID=2714930 RepID=UPI00140CEACC|nr:ClbS/DfsB family four-helix bundle protein [Erysipelothrix sp. HDW6C]QIK69942.1 ClbS/DfsB family four-helix bundle protein [Erysipelothrix sp. HDW6C]